MSCTDRPELLSVVKSSSDVSSSETSRSAEFWISFPSLKSHSRHGHISKTDQEFWRQNSPLLRCPKTFVLQGPHNISRWSRGSGGRVSSSQGPLLQQGFKATTQEKLCKKETPTQTTGLLWPECCVQKSAGEMPLPAGWQRMDPSSLASLGQRLWPVGSSHGSLFPSSHCPSYPLLDERGNHLGVDF